MKAGESVSFNSEALQGLEEYDTDVASWINDVLSPEPDAVNASERNAHQDLSDLEKKVSQLSVALEVACEDASTQLERTIDEISRTVPRLTYDLQLMQENALSLQRSLALVQDRSKVSAESEEMVPVLEELQTLDTIKRNMEASLNVLREAEAWSSLESEVVSYLAEQSYSKAAARLSEAAKSLGVFQNTPEYESRKTLMVNLQNQLEAALSSALVSGINNNDIDACKQFFDMFCHIEREAEFRSYWNGSKRKKLITLWEEAQLQDCTTETPSDDKAGQTYATFLTTFLHELLSVLQIERLAAVLIFPDPQPTLSNFITSTLSSLHPSQSFRLNAVSTYYGKSALPELISSYKAAEEFAVAADKIMEKIGFPLSAPSRPSTSDDREQQHPLGRRRSTRQSFSRRLNRSSISGPTAPNLGQSSLSIPSLDHSWEEALLEPFLDYQCDYTSLEKRYLSAQLESMLAPISASSSNQGARILRERAIDVVSLADDAISRCSSFTHGYGTVGLLQALDHLFQVFLAQARKDYLDATPKAVSLEKGSLDTNDEFAELEYSPSDLATFQATLHLLDAARNILERMNALEAKLRSVVVQTSTTIRLQCADTLGIHISGTTLTALNLLQSSALNSPELQELFEAINPEHPQQPHSAFTPSSATVSASKPIPTSSTRSILLVNAHQSISSFAGACQKRLQDTLLAPLMKHFSTYPSSMNWGADTSRDQSRSAAPGSGNAVSEVNIPTFSLSPTATIQRVAEGLLSLPRLLEVYADDDALAFSIETLPFVDEESLRAFVTENTGGAANDYYEQQQEVGEGERQRPKPRHLASSSSSLSITVPSLHLSNSGPSSGPGTLILTPEAVSSAWLASLALGLLSHLTSHVLPSIPRLGTHGAAQLTEDLSYLGQIARALSVEWPPLEAWRECVGLEEEELRSRLRSVQGGGGGGLRRGDGGGEGEESEKANAAMVGVLRVVGRLRGCIV